MVSRAAQGFLGGAMIPTVFATSFLLFPGEKGTRMSLLIGLTATLAPTIGPTIRWMVDRSDTPWHWLFLINVPIGLLVSCVVWTCLDIDKPALFSAPKRSDLSGLVLMALFLGTLQYVLEEGDRWDWFNDETITWCAAISAIAGSLFIWRMLTQRDPLVELHVLGDINFALGTLFSFVLGIGLYGAVYLIPLFLGRVRGYDSLQIGETMFVTGAAMFVSTPVAGLLARFIDLRVMLAIGLLMFGGGLWWMAHLTIDSDFWELFGPLALRGASIMLIILPANQVTLGRLPPWQVKNASGLYNLMRNLGGTVGLAMIDTGRDIAPRVSHAAFAGAGDMDTAGCAPRDG